MEDLNKITSTRVGDNIHFFVNGKEDSGTVVKMDTSFVTVVKGDGNLQDIHINDTFFIKDILVNKTWNDMSMEERAVALHEIHAYSPRFLAKSWQQLPKELKDVMLEKGKKGALPLKNDEETMLTATSTGRQPASEMTVLTNNADDARADVESYKKVLGDRANKKVETYLQNTNHSNVEQSKLGTVGGNPEAAVETNQKDDADDEYEGQTEDDKKEQFKHDTLKPTTKSMQEEIWEQWLDKGDMGGDSAPAQTSMVTGTTGVYNARYGSDGRIVGQGKDKDEEDKDDKKDDKKEEKKE